MYFFSFFNFYLLIYLFGCVEGLQFQTRIILVIGFLNFESFSSFISLPWLERRGRWALDSFEMLFSCLCHMRGRGLLFVLGPAPVGQQAEAELEADEGSVLAPKPAAVSPVVWASPAFLFRLVLSLALLVFPCPAVAARVSSSLSTTHHVHHFHNKHGTVPIAINRMPFLTRGGHGKNACTHCFLG